MNIFQYSFYHNHSIMLYCVNHQILVNTEDLQLGCPPLVLLLSTSRGDRRPAPLVCECIFLIKFAYFKIYYNRGPWCALSLSFFSLQKVTKPCCTGNCPISPCQLWLRIVEDFLQMEDFTRFTQGTGQQSLKFGSIGRTLHSQRPIRYCYPKDKSVLDLKQTVNPGTLVIPPLVDALGESPKGVGAGMLRWVKTCEYYSIESDKNLVSCTTRYSCVLWHSCIDLRELYR